MYKIIYMKADYEPWWQFDGREEYIVSTEQYDTEHQFQMALNHLLAQFRNKYEFEAHKNERFYAFWSEDECEFCEACDDDAQIYHGIIVLTPEAITQ